MTHILKYEEWNSNGKWLCGDVSALAAGSNTWWYVPSMLGITPVEFVKLLIDKFNCNSIHYKFEKDVLIYSFSSLEDVRKYKNYINKIARQKQFYIY